MATPPEFLYFDLGNVLLYFDHRQACRQVAALAGIDEQRVWDAVFETGLELDYEAGKVTSRDFYERLCKAVGHRFDFDRLAYAASDMFELNLSIVPVITALKGAGHRIGLLSNTNEIHWNFYSDGRYAMIPTMFECCALSFRLGAVKPNPAIYERAAELAGVEPRAIFFTDDVPGHVEAARQVGFDAVPYTSTPELVAELRARGVRFNY